MLVILGVFLDNLRYRIIRVSASEFYPSRIDFGRYCKLSYARNMERAAGQYVVHWKKPSDENRP